MIKSILENLEFKNESGPYNILDIGGGGLGGKNTTDHIVDYFDSKKHFSKLNKFSFSSLTISIFSMRIPYSSCL